MKPLKMNPTKISDLAEKSKQLDEKLSKEFEKMERQLATIRIKSKSKAKVKIK